MTTGELVSLVLLCAIVLLCATTTWYFLWRFIRSREHTARDALNRAHAMERLAEIGSMTSGLAHEIKNPLSTVVLNADLLEEELRDSELDGDQLKQLLRRVESLRREAVRLREILTDFLKFAGRMKLDPQSHDIVKLIEELVDFFHPQAEQSNIIIRSDLPDHQIQMSIDEGLMKQAILNLLLNAVEAMGNKKDGPDRGELMLRVEQTDQHVDVHVIDTGTGIEKDKVESIFLPYASTKPGGSGLGLPTARRIVEEHGGELILHSTPGRGSDFVLHLPARGASPRPAGDI